MRCGRALWHIARSGGSRRRPVTRITWPTTALAIVAPVTPAAVILPLFVSGLLIRGGANLTVISGLGVFGMCAVVIMAGDRILDWSGAPQSVGGGTMAVIVGTASTSIFIVATYFVFGILALNAFLFWSVLVLGAIVLDVGANLRTSDWRLDTRDLAALAALAILVAIWSRSQAAALPTLVTAGHLPAWSDSYILGAVVSQIGSPYVAAFRHIGLAGGPLVVYHYAFLALSAVSAGFLDFPSLGIATAMLTPLGLLVMVLGAYQLVSRSEERRVGKECR